MLKKQRVRKKNVAILLALLVLLLLSALFCLLVGSSGMTPDESLRALFGGGSDAQVRIMRNIRLPRMLAALFAGAGLSLSGLIMQTVLGNPMASPSTLGATNAAAFGANLSLIVFGGGSLLIGKDLFLSGAGEPFAVSLAAFLFAVLSVLAVLGLNRVRAFRADAIVLSGVALGAVWTAATTVLQYSATDVGLSAAVVWSFGDLGRASFPADAMIAAATAAGALFFFILRYRYNALLSGDETAFSMGVNVRRLRALSLVAASLITAVCVAHLGIIGFVGIICPHIAKRLLGQDHRLSIPASLLTGAVLLLLADALSRLIGGGSALPVGAVTSLFGAPFFLVLILRKGGTNRA
ncbi:MAG: iron ABC transporter permease [Clostridia bacterium]|nr:iron ABC transporter permease [Clostridia bacterium]